MIYHEFDVDWHAVTLYNLLFGKPLGRLRFGGSPSRDL
jgi:hypothetical protein